MARDMAEGTRDTTATLQGLCIGHPYLGVRSPELRGTTRNKATLAAVLFSKLCFNARMVRFMVVEDKGMFTDR